MKKKENKEVLNQKDKEKVVKHTKGKTSKKKKIIVILVIVLALCGVGLGIYFYCCENGSLLKDDTNFIKEQVVVESGIKLLEATDFCTKSCELNDESKITYSNQDKDVEDKDLKTMTIYRNDKDEEISKDEAINEDGTLKDDFKEEIIIVSTGTFDVSISHNDRTYSSKLIVQDKTKPELKLKPVEVEEGTEIKIDNFIESCKDNSREECLYEFVNHNEENDTYEKIDDIDKNIGERDIYIKAKDTSNNEVIEKTTLKVNKKPEEPKPTTSNSGSSNKTTSSGSSSTKKPSSNGSSSSSSGSSSNSGSTSKPATNSCGSKGYTYSQSVAYAFWGCNGSEPAGGLTSKINDELFGPAGEKELNACNAHFGNHDCSDWASAIPILDNATGKVVGYYVKFQMEYGGWGDLQVVGTGYMLPGRVVMTSKKY